MENNIFASLEIGNSESRILVCNIRESRIYVLARHGVETEGVEDGNVIHINPLVQKLKALKAHVESDLNQTIQFVTLSLPAINIEIENLQVEIGFEEDTLVKAKHVKQLFRQAMNRPVPAEMLGVNLIPQTFILDGVGFTPDPAGHKARTLGFVCQRAAAPSFLVYQLMSAVEMAGFRVADILVGSTAEAMYSMGNLATGKNMCHVNIGKTSTTLTVVSEGVIRSTKALSIGGHDATEDICEAFNVDEKTAIGLKHSFGRLTAHTHPQEAIHINDSQEATSYITRGMLGNVLAGRYEMILKVVRQYLLENSFSLETMTYVFTGGGSEISGLPELAAKLLNSQAAIYRPPMLGVRHAGNSNLVGTAILGYELTRLTGVKHTVIDFGQYNGKPSQNGEGNEPYCHSQKSFMDHKLENSGVLVRLFDKMFEEKAE